MSATAESSRLFSGFGCGCNLGALPENENEYQDASGVLLSPGQNGLVRSSYTGPGTLASFVPSYPQLPRAPAGSQGLVDFPYDINPPSVTGNFYWWTGSGVINAGFPRYSNDCWEYLRYAMVESDFDSVIKWLAWAVVSFQWKISDIQQFNFGAWRFIDAKYAPPGAVNSRGYYRVPTWGQTSGVPQNAPVSGVVSGGASSGTSTTRLLGLGAVSLQMTQPLWWSLADLNAFYRSLEKYADPNHVSGKCLDGLLSNWNQAWNNYARGVGGPILPIVTLASCPSNDNFWQGLAIFVVAVVAIYFGGVALAGAYGTAGAGAGVAAGAASADTALVPATVAAAGDVTVDTVAPTLIESAATDAAATATGGAAASAVGTTAAETLTEVTVTAPALSAGGGITAGQVAAATAAAGTAASAASSGSSAAESTSSSGGGNSQPSSGSSFPTLQQTQQAIGTARSAASLITQLTGARRPSAPAYVPPATYQSPLSTILNARIFGVPLLAVGIGVVAFTMLRKHK